MKPSLFNSAVAAQRHGTIMQRGGTGGHSSDSDDDLERVFATQQNLRTPTIKSVKQAMKRIALPAEEKAAHVSISMCLFSKKRFARGWYLTMIDYKRGAKFAEDKSRLEGLPFQLRKQYLLSLALYLVPYKSKEATTIPDVPYQEGAILHCTHVTGLSINDSGIPKGNVSSSDRIVEDKQSAAVGEGVTVAAAEKEYVPPAIAATGNEEDKADQRKRAAKKGAEKISAAKKARTA